MNYELEIRQMRRSILGFLPSLFLVFFFYLLSASVVSAATLSKPPNNLGLVGYWSFNEGSGTQAGDYSGNGNTGSFNGNPSWVNGRFGNGLEFDGNDHISMGDIHSAPTEITLSAWVNLDSVVEEPILIKGMGAAGNREYGMYILSNKVFASVAREAAGDVDSKSGATTVGTGAWVHAAMTWDGSTLTIYKDGDDDGSVATSVGSGDIQDLADSLIIGRDETGDYFNGEIDEVRIYNRALSATEVAALYQQGQARFASSASLDDGTSLEQDLVGHWTFDGKDMVSNVADVSGQGNHGTLVGQAATTTVLGKLGQALELDGDDDYVDVGTTDDLNVTETVTLSAWIKSDHSFGSDLEWASLISRLKNGSPYSGYELGVGGSYAGGSNKAFFHVGGSYSSNSMLGTTAVNDGEWHHLVGIYDGTNSYIYVDGGLQNSGAKTNLLNNTGEQLDIGNNYRRSHRFTGTVDDVRIYSRDLSAEEVAQLYRLGEAKFNASSDAFTQGTTLESGLVGHWTFDGPDMISNVADVSGQGNHGTLEGQTSTTTAIGKLGQALEFDGSDDYINAGAPSDVNWGSGDGSVSAWVKTSADFSSVYGVVVINGAGQGGQKRYVLHLSGAGGETNYPRFDIDDNSSLKKVVGDAAINDGEWHHLVGVRDSNSLRLYVDGVAMTPTDITGSGDIDDTEGLTFGATNNGEGGRGNGQWFDGLIDEVRIYNRALSADEALQLYRLGQ